MRGRQQRCLALKSRILRGLGQGRKRMITVRGRSCGGDRIHLTFRKIDYRTHTRKQLVRSNPLALPHAGVKADWSKSSSDSAYRTGHRSRPAHARPKPRPQIAQRNACCQTHAEARRGNSATRNFTQHLLHRPRTHRNYQHLGPFNSPLQILRDLYSRLAPQCPQLFRMAIVHHNLPRISGEPQPRDQGAGDSPST